jgi:hypothetical protein
MGAPARLVTAKTFSAADATAATLSGKSVGAVAGSAREAYLKTFFPGVAVKTFPDFAALHDVLRAGTVDAIFGDGLSPAVWLAGESSADCFVFRGAPSPRAGFSSRASPSPCARKMRTFAAQWTGRSPASPRKASMARFTGSIFRWGFIEGNPSPAVRGRRWRKAPDEGLAAHLRIRRAALRQRSPSAASASPTRSPKPWRG